MPAIRKKPIVRRAPASKRPRPSTLRMFVAVVVRKDREPDIDLEVLTSSRGAGDWACFIGTNHARVVAKAMHSAERWSTDVYEVWTGELTGLVRRPEPSFDIVPVRWEK